MTDSFSVPLSLPRLSTHQVYDQAIDDGMSSLSLVEIDRRCEPKARTPGIILKQAHLPSDAVVKVRPIYRAVRSLVRGDVLSVYHKGKKKVSCPYKSERVAL